MRVGFSDSGPTLYLVQGRAKPVLHGPNSTESNQSDMEKPHTGLDECPRILLWCLRARNSAERATMEIACKDSTMQREEKSNRGRNGGWSVEARHCIVVEEWGNQFLYL